MGLQNDEDVMEDSSILSKENSNINEYSKSIQYECPIPGCNKFFGKKSRLVYHERTHTGEKPFLCSYEDCDSSYKRRSHLIRHITASHSNEPSKFKISCDKCNKNYSNIYSFRKHQTICRAEFPYSCLDCDFKFRKESQLIKHQFIHTGVCPYRCSYKECDKGFLLKSKLTSHMKMHCKQYICPYDSCTEIFNLYSMLRHHLRDHKKKCDICTKEFDLLSQLRKHFEAQHAELREALFCPYTPCERYYFDEKNLKVHIGSKHDKIPKTYSCHVCHTNMVTKQSLLRHLKKIHDPDYKQRTKKTTRPPRKPRKDKGLPKTDFQKYLSSYWPDEDAEAGGSGLIGEHRDDDANEIDTTDGASTHEKKTTSKEWKINYEKSSTFDELHLDDDHNSSSSSLPMDIDEMATDQEEICS